MACPSDRGGLVQWARGERPATKHEAAQSETYLAKLLYDEFGQRVYQRVGNGVVTKYGYDEKTRRLGTLHARKPGERLLQDLTYGYDLVGNVLAMTNDLGEPDPSHAGRVDFRYEYDDLHRLTDAHGEAKSRPGTLDTFTSKFEYSDIHAMTSNVQVHQVLHGPTGGGEFPPQTNHDLTYAYGGVGPHQATRIGDTSLVYDGNGNTVRECRDPADPTCTERPAHLRRLYWTEENRLDAVIDGGERNATKFYYDASGERIAKLGRGGESITVGQFWSVKGRRAAMKHVFIGAARVASKLLPPPGWDDVPRGPPDSSEPSTTPTTVNNESGCDPSSYSPQKCQYLPGGDPVLNDYYADAKVRPETYYYHPDHLGSMSWVTDQNARVHERVEYFPYGAVWRDTRSDIGASPVKGQRFLFTGKEIDEETGLYYFGARYYDPRAALWASPDPVIRTLSSSVPPLLSAYSYAFSNPVRLVDPDGQLPAPYEVADSIKANKAFQAAVALNDRQLEYELENPEPGGQSFALLLRFAGETLDRWTRLGVGWAKFALEKGQQRWIYFWEDVGTASEMALAGLQLVPKPKVSLDANALVNAIEGDGAALDLAGNRRLMVSPQAAREFMKGSRELRDAVGVSKAREISAGRLRSFMEGTGAKMGPHSTREVSDFFRRLGLKKGDAAVMGSGLLEGGGTPLPLITQDQQLIGKMCKAGLSVEEF